MWVVYGGNGQNGKFKPPPHGPKHRGGPNEEAIIVPSRGVWGATPAAPWVPYERPRAIGLRVMWACIKECWNGLPTPPPPYNHTRFWDTNAYFVRGPDPIRSTPVESTNIMVHSYRARKSLVQLSWEMAPCEKKEGKESEFFPHSSREQIKRLSDSSLWTTNQPTDQYCAKQK